MRKITKEACKAFYDCKRYKKDNTEVKLDENGMPRLYLFDVMIAWAPLGIVWFSMRGYNTVTTRERLRGLGIDIRCNRGRLRWFSKLGEYETYCTINPDGIYDTHRTLNQRPIELE